VPPERSEEVDEVARLTMSNALPQVMRIVDGFLELGFHPTDAPHTPPPGDATERLRVLEQEIGSLPAALTAIMSEIGQVSLTGDCPALGLYYEDEDDQDRPELPDPLVLPGVGYLEYSWHEARHHGEGSEPFVFVFAPDDLHKANISGSTQDLELPDSSADPVIAGVGLSVVEYLRLSVSRGGLAGFGSDMADYPAALGSLCQTPRF
jgi:hypothetical protein